jgi:hypothetical protein
VPRELNVYHLLTCPQCGAGVSSRPAVEPGRCFMAVLPCRRCHAYSAYLIAEDGTTRAWVLRSEATVAVGSG